MTVKELVKLAQQGNEDAFCTLYDIHKDRLYRYAFYRLGNAEDAQDAVSDTVLSAYTDIGKLNNGNAFSGWIFRILSRKCAKYIDEQVKRRESVDIESAYNIKAEGYIPDGTLTDVQRALKLLSEEDRELVLLSVVGGFDSRELSKLTGMKAGNVRSRLSRALAKMREALE